MKRIVFLLIVLFTAGMISAQQKEASITAVGSAVYDFGEVKESDGDVSHTFTVINNGELPLVISRVEAGCECTVTKDGWTKEPIQPGKTGSITVTYKVAGRQGSFSRPVNVFSNGSKGSYVLTIMGVVKQ